LYNGELTNHDLVAIDTTAAIEDLATTHSGSLELWYRELGLLFGISTRLDSDPAAPGVWLSVDPVEFESEDSGRTPDTVRRQVATLVEFVTFVAERTNPSYGCGCESRTETHRFPLDGSMVRGGTEKIEEIFWLTLFNPASVERIGRDKLLAAPAWQVTELATRAVLMVLTDDPFDIGAIADARSAVESHLDFLES